MTSSQKMTKSKALSFLKLWCRRQFHALVTHFNTMHFADGVSSFSVDAESHFKLPFSVSKTEVAYVGQLKMTLSSGKNTFCMKVYGSGILQ